MLLRISAALIPVIDGGRTMLVLSSSKSSPYNYKAIQPIEPLRKIHSSSEELVQNCKLLLAH